MNPITGSLFFFLALTPLSGCADEFADPSVHEGGLSSPDEALLIDQALIDAQVFDGGGSSIDIWSNGVGDVHQVLDQIGFRSLISEVRMRFQPEPGYELRLRFRTSAGTWGTWSPWSAERSDHRTTVPAPGGEVIDDFQIELRESGSSPTIAVGGYIRVKKLTS